MKICCKLLGILFLLALVLTAAAEEKKVRRILYIDSYSTIDSWWNNTFTSFVDSLEHQSCPVAIETVSFGIRNRQNLRPGPADIEALHQKLRSEPYDLVVTAGNVATDLFLNKTVTLPAKMPMVFLGYRRLDDRFTEKLTDRMTGVILPGTLLENIHLGFSMRPDAAKVAVVLEGTPTGIELKRMLEKELPVFDGPEFLLLTGADYSTDEMLAKLRLLPENSFVVFYSWATGRGETAGTQGTSIAKIRAQYKGLILDNFDTYADSGLPGGVLNSSRIQGEKGAKLALRIFNGAQPENLPVEAGSTETLFDYAALAKLKLPNYRLPADVTVLNEPESFWWLHRTKLLFIAAMALTAFLTSLLFMMVLLRRARRWIPAFSIIPIHSVAVDANEKILFQQLFEDFAQMLPRKPRVLEDFPEEVVRSFREPIHRVFRTGEPYSMEYELFGKRRKAEFRRLPAGVFGREAVIWLSIDIEELHRTREATIASAERFRLTIESIGDGVIATDANGVITLANSVSSRLTGYPAPEMIGQRIDEVLHLSSSTSGSPLLSPIMRSLSSGKPVELSDHTDLVSRDGSRRHIADSAAPILDGEGRISGAVMIFRDVTSEYEKRDSLYLQNRLLNTAAQVAEITYFRCNGRGDLIEDSMNAALRETLNDAHIPAGDWVFEEDRPLYREQWQRLLDHEIDTLESYYRADFNDELRFFEMRVERTTAPATGVNGYFGVIRDVTRLKQSEANYRDTNQLLQSIIENFPCVLFVKDIDNDFRYILGNRAHAALLNLPCEAIVGKTDYELFSRPEDADQCAASDRAVLEAPGQIHDCTERVRGNDGQIYANRNIKCVIRRENGRRLLLGIGIDISRQEAAERELAQTTRLLQTIMENLPCALFVKDPDNDYRYIMANRNFADFVGFDIDEMPGKTDHDIFILPENADGCGVSDRKAVELGQVFDCKETVMAADRNTYTLRCVKGTVEYDDGRRLLLGICLDITQQEQAEEKLNSANRLLQSMMDNMPLSFWVKDPADHFRFVIGNRALHTMLDLPGGSIPGKTDFDVFNREEAQKFFDGDTIAMEQPEGLDRDETIVVNGETRYLHMRRFPLDSGDGHPLLLGMAVDVTERVNSRNELQKANGILNALLNNLPALVAVKDPLDSFKYIIWNNAAAEFTGFDAPTVIGRHDSELNLPLPKSLESLHTDLQVSEGKKIDRVYKFVNHNGQDFFLKTIKTQIPLDSDHSLILTLGIDITEQKLMENKLAAMTNSLKGYVEQEQVISSTLEAVALNNDDEGAMHEVLKLLSTRLGAEYSYLLALNLNELRIDSIFEYATPGYPETMQNFQPVTFLPGELWHEEFLSHRMVELQNLTSEESVHYLGSVVFGLPKLSPLTERSAFFGIGVWKGDQLWGNLGLVFLHGKPELGEQERALLQSAAHIIEIILERQLHRADLARSEYEKLLIMDSLKIPIMLFDTELRLIQANNAAHQLVRLAPEALPSEEEAQYAELATADGRYLMPPEALRRDRFGEHVEEIRYKGRDYILSSYPIEIEGKLLYLLKTMVDVTDANEVRRKLASALEAAQSASKAKSFFLATVSHELRTPLNVVIGFSELLKQGGMGPKEQSDCIQSINLAGNALLNLINDVLDLSKIEAEQMDITPQPTDLRKISEEIVAIFSYKAKQKKLDFYLEIPDDLPMVQIDSLRLRQILLNVVGNALKFTHEGFVRVRIEFTPNAGVETATLTIHVIDTGVGISPEYRSRIFEPFVQQRSTKENPNNEGTGLGLAITNRLVNKMGGAIQLESEVGKGSTFTIILTDIRYGDPRLETPALPAPVMIAKPASELDVLIVDDVPMNLKVLKAMLKQLQVSCRTANSAQEALTAIEEKTPDLVLTDMWMPEMNGCELAAAIRTKPEGENLKVIAVTADSETSANFDMSHFDEVLLKPLTLEKLRPLFTPSA